MKRSSKRWMNKMKPHGKWAQKALLMIALLVLLGSRVLSSVATIQDVQASFPTERAQGEIATPSVEIAQATSVDVHVQVQEMASGQKDVRLEELSERSRRAARIRDFYARWNSPMAPHAEYIVDAAERWGMDWRLIPAISIVESSGGNFCFKPYNAFGWGKMGFNSFEESIETVTRGLATGYRTSNPYAIGPKYNPVTPEAWSGKVAGLMSQI